MVTLPAAAKKVVSAAEAMGFTVETRPFQYRKEATLWKSSGDGHSIGDVKTPEKLLDGIQVVGYRTDARLGFEVSYAGGFLNARVIDPVGRPVELHADYTYTEKQVKDYGYTQMSAMEAAERRDREYNDGAQIIEREWFITAANQFYEWVDEWVQTLRADHPPITPKRRAPQKSPEPTAEERESALLDGGEWVG